MKFQRSEENVYQNLMIRLLDIFSQFSWPKMKERFNLLKSFALEPATVSQYATPLNLEKRISEYFGVYSWIAIIVVITWFVINLTIVLLDIPRIFSHIYEPYFIQEWKIQVTFLARLKLYLLHNIPGLLTGLLFGGMLSLPYAFILSYVGGIFFGLAVSLATAFSTGFYSDVAWGLSFGFSFGFAYSIPAAIFRDFVKIVSGGLLILAIFFIFGGFKFGFGLLIGFPVFFIIYYRLPFYPLNLIKSLFCNSLNNTPFHKDGFIWLRLFGLKRKLISYAQEDPHLGFVFSDFLLKYRPLQTRLSMQLMHAATSFQWQEADFDGTTLSKKNRKKLKQGKMRPSPEWYKKLATGRAELVASEQQSSIQYRLEYRKHYLKQLKEFREHTQAWEPASWNKYYSKTLDRWIRNEEEELESIQHITNQNDSFIHDVYRVGTPLSPEFDRHVFMEREQLKQDLQSKILSDSHMPVFLIYGQRRVGKTSLLKFLPEILGPGFKVIYMDLKPISSIPQWLKGLKKAFDQIEKSDYPSLPEVKNNDWLDMWYPLQKIMEIASQKVDDKIILALDEYEKLQFHFRKTPSSAKKLLDAIRNFFQNQDRVICLFAGSTLFSELKKPLWTNYFTQTESFQVDYLSREETQTLIDVAGLEYPEDVSHRIAYLTQGHPTLVQRICHEMVNIANNENRKQMTMKDLDDILLKYIFRPQNGVTEIFWHQFCENKSMKNTVLKIIREEPCSDNKSVITLEQHGFIVKDEESQKYKMRVPIFQQWLYKFGGYI